jgi:hypothetical protein
MGRRRKNMMKICKHHFKNLAVSRQICEIILNKEFSNLCEELLIIYKTSSLHEPEKEAFQDAFYCIIAQENSSQSILNRALSF